MTSCVDLLSDTSYIELSRPAFAVTPRDVPPRCSPAVSCCRCPPRCGPVAGAPPGPPFVTVKLLSSGALPTEIFKPRWHVPGVSAATFCSRGPVFIPRPGAAQACYTRTRAFDREDVGAAISFLRGDFSLYANAVYGTVCREDKLPIIRFVRSLWYVSESECERRGYIS